MDLSPILNPLNDAQRAAVTAPLGPVLVLAGAGSGKTRVLTHRVAWVIAIEGASPHSILAVTFTNKAAARDARPHRDSCSACRAARMWVGTFHGIAHRLLRLHWREANLPQGFQILDARGPAAADQEDRQGAWSSTRRAGCRARSSGSSITTRTRATARRTLKDGGDPTRRQLIRLYAEYEAQCQRTGVVDFAELLLRAYELWRDNPALLEHYQQRFRHVLVDEFQDTNAIQYAWALLIAGQDGAPFVVGDDDQSIYRWRGARVENLTRFTRDYPGAQDVPPRAELPLHRQHPRGRERADRATTPGASARTCGPAARGRAASGCTPRSTSATRPSSS